jgi:hypothetical protein
LYYTCIATTCSGCDVTSGTNVCYSSSQLSVCACATTQFITGCAANGGNGSETASCDGSLDCCRQEDPAGDCCECAGSAYLQSLALSCSDWIRYLGGTQVSHCP